MYLFSGEVGGTNTTANFLTEVENRDLIDTSGISLMDHASDQARMASLKEHIAKLIGTALGESGLFRWGFPDVDVLDILDSLLESANVRPFTVKDVETSLRSVMASCSPFPHDHVKSKFAAYRRKIYASKVVYSKCCSIIRIFLQHDMTRRISI